MVKNLWDTVVRLFRLLWREVAKFGTVGAIAFVVDSAVFWWMMHGPLEGSNVKAKLVGGVVGTLVSWLLNRWWTYRHSRQSNVMRELLLFLLMNAIGLGIQAGFVFVAQYGFGVTDTLGLFIWGNIVGMFFGTLFRFFAYRFWVFTATLDPPEKEDSLGEEDLLAPESSSEQKTDQDSSTRQESSDSQS